MLVFGLIDPEPSASSAERDEEAGPVLEPAEDEVAEDVRAGEVEDGLVAAEHAIGEEAAEERRQVTGRHEPRA